jgi:hypothetical protein
MDLIVRSKEERIPVSRVGTMIWLIFLIELDFSFALTIKSNPWKECHFICKLRYLDEVAGTISSFAPLPFSLVIFEISKTSRSPDLIFEASLVASLTCSPLPSTVNTNPVSLIKATFQRSIEYRASEGSSVAKLSSGTMASRKRLISVYGIPSFMSTSFMPTRNRTSGDGEGIAINVVEAIAAPALTTVNR